jgi:hypothetical protein
MTMNVEILENDLYAAVITAFKLSELPDGDDKDSATAAYRVLAVELSTAIDAYIKTATVNVTTSKDVLTSTSTAETVNSTGDLE